MKLLNKALTNKFLLFSVSFCSLFIGSYNLELSSWWFFPPMCIGEGGRDALISTLVFITSFSITAFGIRKLLQQNHRGIGVGFILTTTTFLISVQIAYFIFNNIRSL
jgi:hypothetical protein